MLKIKINLFLFFFQIGEQSINSQLNENGHEEIHFQRAVDNEIQEINQYVLN